MRLLQKLTSMFILGVVIFSLSGCGQKTEESAGPEATPATEAQATSGTEAEATPAP